MTTLCGALQNAPEAALLCRTLARLAEEETGGKLTISIAVNKEVNHDKALSRQGRSEGGGL